MYSGQMDTTGAIGHVHVPVRDIESDHPLQRFNRSIFLRDGDEFEFCIQDWSGWAWIWYRFCEGVLQLSLMSAATLGISLYHPHGHYRGANPPGLRLRASLPAWGHTIDIAAGPRSGTHSWRAPCGQD